MDIFQNAESPRAGGCWKASGSRRRLDPQSQRSNTYPLGWIAGPTGPQSHSAVGLPTVGCPHARSGGRRPTGPALATSGGGRSSSPSTLIDWRIRPGLWWVVPWDQPRNLHPKCQGERPELQDADVPRPTFDPTQVATGKPYPISQLGLGLHQLDSGYADLMAKRDQKRVLVWHIVSV